MVQFANYCARRHSYLIEPIKQQIISPHNSSSNSNVNIKQSSSAENLALQNYGYEKLTLNV